MRDVIRALLVVLILIAAVYDWKYRRIPNWLTLTGVVVGLGANVMLAGISGAWLSVSGAGLALLIYLPLYALRALGGGDVKLMAAIGALVGPFVWWWIFVYTALIGGVIALVVIVTRGRFQRTFKNLGMIVLSLVRLRRPADTNPELDVRTAPRSHKLPHAVTIAVGAVAYLILGPLR
jgi:prepilin peptidase CpaA